MRNFPKILALHEETISHPNISFDYREWPDSWKIVEFKEYPRFPKISLPAPLGLENKFMDVLESRHSGREFDKENSLSSQELSSLLFWSAGIGLNKDQPEQSFRFYPSGGARYPLEIYFYFRGNKEISEGLYHYNVRHHGLEKILDGQESKTAINALPTWPFAYEAALFFFLTGVLERTMRKYGERGYRFALMESGILLQNFYLTATALNIGCCGIGNAFDKEVEQLLDIVAPEEIFIGSFVAGPLKKK